MAPQKHSLAGGSFAPPLRDELLASYDAQIAALDPKEPATDALKTLLACVRAWWEEPESAGNGKPHPYFGAAAPIVALDQPIAERLWDAIPWDHELEAMKPLLDRYEPEAAARNRNKIEAWHFALHQAICAQLAPGANPDSLYAAYRLYAATHKVAALLGDSVARATAGAAIAAAFPGWSGEKVVNQVEQIDTTFAAVLSGKQTPPVPRPALEPTPIRDMAHSLLWHACELERDREPLTADKVGA